MPQKGTSKGAAPKAKSASRAEAPPPAAEEGLQAVVLADLWDSAALHPLTLETPLVSGRLPRPQRRKSCSGRTPLNLSYHLLLAGRRRSCPSRASH
jgi:hypothetical protein